MKQIPRGVRQNNPGNLRPLPGGKKWKGELDPIDNYCSFKDAHSGIRAMARNLITYQTKHGLGTVDQIIHRWAPPGDNNDTDSYRRAVAAELRVDAFAGHLDLRDYITLASLVRAIIRHENGMQPYAAEDILTAVKDALAS